MPAIRVIPCLDVADGIVVKGTNFQNLRGVGKPIQLAEMYSSQGADEVAVLDISATFEAREAMLDLVSECAEKLTVPLTVGGGIRSKESVGNLLRAGADKVSIGSAGVTNPQLLQTVAQEYGNQVLTVSLDVQRGATASGFELTVNGGRIATGIDAIIWASQLEGLGVGEILLNSIDTDGTRGGFDLELIARVRAVSALPLIASGGAGNQDDFVLAASAGADAVLAASVFHSGHIGIGLVKAALAGAGFEVREVTIS